MVDKKNSFDDIVVEEVKTLEDGNYVGLISDINRDTENYDYTRYTVQIKDHDMTLAVSYPTRVTVTKDGVPSSDHASFLSRMGVDVVNLKDKPLTDVIYGMLNKEVKFLVQNKESKKQKGKFFSEIVRDSVKPVK
jgi:hypothetical protein